jgi:hypothetical protein
MRIAGSNVNKTVILPKYKFDDRLKLDREVDSPPPSLFIPLGFNENKLAGNKHYRRYYPDELEDVREVIPRKPFHEERIFRGQTRAGSFFGFFNSNQSVD